MYPRITRIQDAWQWRNPNDELEAMTNDQMMAKRFEMLAFQRFNI